MQLKSRSTRIQTTLDSLIINMLSSYTLKAAQHKPMKKSSLTIILCIIIMLTTGCATTSNYGLAVRSWNHANAKTLTRVWGYPNRMHRLPNGNILYAYHDVTFVVDPITTIPGHETIVHRNHEVVVHRSGPIVTGGGAYTLKCHTWFEVNPYGKIVNTSFRGNNCVATDAAMEKMYNPHKPLPQKKK